MALRMRGMSGIVTPARIRLGNLLDDILDARLLARRVSTVTYVGDE